MQELSSTPTEGIEIRLRTATPSSWAEEAVRRLPEFLADHAACELQAAVFALSLVATYPGHARLVDVLTALAMEELRHFRKAVRECRKLGASVSTRRRNPYVAHLRAACKAAQEPLRGVELLLVAALIEARSHERFMCLLPHLHEPRLQRFYRELADAESRHGPAYLELAVEHGGAERTRERLEELLAVEAEALSGPSERLLSVHSRVPRTI